MYPEGMHTLQHWTIDKVLFLSN